MNIFSDIAKDYLADYEVLTEARKEFEKQLSSWWGVLASKHLVPSLVKINKGEINRWDGKDGSGESSYRVVENQDCYLWIADPRTCEAGCYIIGLELVSQQALKKLKYHEAFVKRFDALASELKIGGATGLNWASTELATEVIKILPDDPEETARLTCEVAVRYFQMVMEHHKIMTEDKKNKKGS